MTKPPTSVVVVSDIHGVKVDRRAWSVAMQIIEHVGPEEVWNLGDSLDLCSLNRHEAAPEDAGIDVADEFANGRRLNEDIRIVHEAGWRRRTGAGARRAGRLRRRFFQGNHEYRYMRALQDPALKKWKTSLPKDVCDPAALNLAATGWEYIDRERQEPYMVGRLGVFHGHWYNQHHASKHLFELGCDVLYGHTHRPQQVSKRNAVLGSITATAAPCLRVLDREWEHMKKAAFAGWSHGVTVITFNGDRPFAQNVLIEDGRSGYGGTQFLA